MVSRFRFLLHVPPVRCGGVYGRDWPPSVTVCRQLHLPYRYVVPSTTEPQRLRGPTGEKPRGQDPKQNCIHCRVQKGTGSQVKVILNKETAHAAFYRVCEAIVEASGPGVTGACSAPVLSVLLVVCTEVP